MADKSGESRKSKDWLGNERTEHFDKSGKKTGESRDSKDWLGNKRTEHYDRSGKKTGESRDSKDWLGTERAEHFDRSGKKTGESRDSKDWLGSERTEHFDRSGKKAGESGDSRDWLGSERTEHYGEVPPLGARRAAAGPPKPEGREGDRESRGYSGSHSASGSSTSAVHAVGSQGEHNSGLLPLLLIGLILGMLVLAVAAVSVLIENGVLELGPRAVQTTRGAPVHVSDSPYNSGIELGEPEIEIVERLPPPEPSPTPTWSSEPSPAQPQPQEEARPAVLSAPAGHRLKFELQQEINSAEVSIGDRWQGVVAEAVVIGGETIIELGADIQGNIVSLGTGGNSGSAIVLDIVSVETISGWQRVRAGTASAGDSYTDERFPLKETVIGSGLGAALGAAVGGKKGAAIGAAAGGIGGAAVGSSRSGTHVRIAVGTVMTAPLEEDLKVMNSQQ